LRPGKKGKNRRESWEKEGYWVRYRRNMGRKKIFNTSDLRKRGSHQNWGEKETGKRGVAPGV